MPRGGRRAGTPGRSYSNRSDLNQTRTLPVARIPNQDTYGDQAAQIRAQKSVPVVTRGVPAGGGSSSPPVTATGTPLIPLDAPTTRPNEPLTAGVDIGAGPGAAPHVLESAEQWRQWLPGLEKLARMPGVTTETRNLIRFIRSQL